MLPTETGTERHLSENGSSVRAEALALSLLCTAHAPSILGLESVELGADALSSPAPCLWGARRGAGSVRQFWSCLARVLKLQDLGFLRAQGDN